VPILSIKNGSSRVNYDLFVRLLRKVNKMRQIGRYKKNGFM